MNVLRDNIVLMALAVLIYAALCVLCGKTAMKRILSTAEVILAAAVIFFLLYSGAELEELFLMLIVFGAISVAVGSADLTSRRRAEKAELQIETGAGSDLGNEAGEKVEAKIEAKVGVGEAKK